MQIIAIIGVAASLGTAIHLHKPVSVVTVPVPVMPSGPASSHLSPPAVSDPIPVPRPFPSTAVAADRNRSVAAAPRSAGSRLAPPKGGPGDPDATHPAPKVSGIAGSHLLELSPEALRKLGLGVDSLGVVSCWLEEGQLFEWRITSSGIQMGTTG